MAGETLDFKVTVEAQQAQAEVAKFSGKLSEVEGNAKKAGAALASVERHTTSAATGTRNVGQAALEASRAFEDLQYGVGGVVNNIPSLVMSLGGSMGLTAAISLAAVGVNQIVKNFGGVDPATKQATDAAREHVKSLRDEISGLGRDLRALQVGAERAASERQAGALMEAQRGFEQAVAPIGGADRFRRLRDNEKLVGTIAEQMKIAREAADRLDLEIQKMAAMRRIELEKEDQRKIDAAVDVANAITESEKKAGAERITEAKKEADAKFAIYVAGLEDEEKQLREAKKASDKRNEEERKQRGKDLADSFKDFDEQWKAAEKAEEKRTKIAERESEKRKKIAEAEREAQIDSLTSFATGAATAAGRFAAEAAMGQEDAFANLLNAAAQAAGGQIVLEGGKLVAGGIASLLIGNPAAPGQIAGGLGLVAAGTAIQTGGPAAVQSLLGMAGGGGAGASASASSASRDRGASPRSSRGGDGGGGPLVINVSYGVGGPLPEDTAREISRVMQTGNRRRGAA